MNESLNNIIWTRCPKRVYVGNSIFKTAVASAVISFNDGANGLLPVFEKIGIECGFFTTDGFNNSDINRIIQCNRKSSDSVKSKRKSLHAERKGFNDQNELEEGETYASGKF